MDALTSAQQDDSSGATHGSVKSDDSSPLNDNGRNSPPPKCAICLGTCRNKSFTDSCLHQFCFKCLLTWSKVKAECPLCKQNFRSIIHNVRSNHQYEEYMVEQRQTEDIVERIDSDTIANATRRFRYRTTLTLPRRETIAIQQLLLHYPMVADVFPPPAHRRRSPGSFRRTVYRYNLWARPLPDFTGRFRDCTPEFYRFNDSQMHRLVPWLTRELHYLLNENIAHTSYVIAKILELLPEYHINSAQFRETMQRYFGDRTEHFLHELYCFASTPYDMTGYDRNVQYTTDSRISTLVNEVISSTESEASVDSDIVMISTSEPADPPPGPSRVPAPVYPQNYIPEPAVSTAATASSNTTSDNVITIETMSQSDTDDDSSEVMVVGYIKPPQDRTPEVVDLLGSDSDVIVQESGNVEPAPSEPQDGRPSSLVKITLRNHTARPDPGSDSESSAYTPPPIEPRRRRGSTRSETSSSTQSSSYMSQVSKSKFSSTSLSAFSTDSTDSDFNARRRKPKRKIPLGERNRRRLKKTNNPVQIQPHNVPAKEKQNKRKSCSGKGVKSSKKPREALPPEPRAEPRVESRGEPRVEPRAEPRAEPRVGSRLEPSRPPPEQPSTSGTSRSNKRKLDSDASKSKLNRESKRLRSVVNVINGQKNSGESSSSSKCSCTLVRNTKKNGSSAETDKKSEKPQTSAAGTRGAALNGSTVDAENSDSEDDLPLNLSLMKKTFNSSLL